MATPGDRPQRQTNDPHQCQRHRWGSFGRMIDKDGIYVRRHEKTLSKGGTNYPAKTAGTLTPGGIQGGTLYGEDFIFSLFQKYKPELLGG